MYMDDVKVFAKIKKKLERLMQSVITFSQDIRIEFRIKRWAMNKGKGETMKGNHRNIHRKRKL